MNPVLGADARAYDLTISPLVGQSGTHAQPAPVPVVKTAQRVFTGQGAGPQAGNGAPILDSFDAAQPHPMMTPVDWLTMKTPTSSPGQAPLEHSGELDAP